LLFPKGASLVVAILGALKSGKMFVVLDPTLPHARLRYILADSQASLIVANDEYCALATALAQMTPCLNIDHLNSGLCGEAPQISRTPNDFAYILYTSGSTGQPKGIVENHRNLLHYIMTETNDLHICAEDRLTFLASQGRDIFRAILNGAAVYPIEIRQDGLSSLARWLIEEEITIYNSVASAFRDFVNTLTGVEQFPHLRLIKLMGETVYRRDVELYRKHFSERCILVNWYGPNETGLLSRYLVDNASQITSSVVPVGYAVKDKEILVLDEDGNDLGVQQPGEIAVRSRYMSPEYWRRPDLTRAAFILASSEGTSRLYRTGDLGALLPDGCLVHLGRKDFQVKIRGYRVEIAEVEMALMDLDPVKEAVVVAREDVLGHKRLIAYIVLRSTPAPTTSALRAALTVKLPDYMVPSVSVFLDKIPVIGIGKIDRNALPAPTNSRPALDEPYVSPRTPLEEELSRIWAEVLSLDQVGIHDNFFDLGGHSLAATRVVSQVIKKCQLELPLQSLFQSPTVAETAAIITQHQAKRASDAELAQMLREVEAMTEEEAQKQLAGESARSSKGDGHE
jgi:amino acid adenylation domain-containing protein